MKYWLLLVMIVSTPFGGMCHEVRPAYLGITQLTGNQVEIVWKVPAQSNRVLGIMPQFPPDWNVKLVSQLMLDGAFRQQFRMEIPADFRGSEIYFDGLSATMTDVLARAEFADGSQQVELIRPAAPVFRIPMIPSPTSVARTYFLLGVDHIWLGIDHLLFVLGLVLITVGGWKIFKTVTAFTLAHSITLSLAALNLIHVPIPPVEAMIALSILFLAWEAIRHRTGHATLTGQKPWWVAFSFGLLHGVGFASALGETGLPHGDIPLALGMFNVGVEFGQIVFVAILLGIRIGARRFFPRILPPAYRMLAYAIGGCASFWLIERIVGFWG
ncbi:HupE/UreJ family protein [Pontibacter sp. G13]|uniref:HupE/UreJ family protein n=1 Tax=Pontibacter sp. G13 TaxID=3074898 RepID=UPI0028894D98|nr:HupE/UreJ family protein [Pontibacter sp. G13]WNJ18429.1 HupE/UreJ family protein [Pontibacter sp. G13]